MGVLGDATPRLKLLAGGETTAGDVQFRAGSLRIPTIEVAGPVCALDAASGTARIGSGLLACFRAAIGFPASFVRLEPIGALPVTSAPIEGTGLTPVSLQEGYWTVGVAEGSPADEGGVSPGDAVLAVNGAAMQGVAWTQLSALLNPITGQEVRLSLRHAGETQACVLVSRRLL